MLNGPIWVEIIGNSLKEGHDNGSHGQTIKTQGRENPKSEFRNPKQIQIFKIQMIKTSS